MLQDTGYIEGVSNPILSLQGIETYKLTQVKITPQGMMLVKANYHQEND